MPPFPSATPDVAPLPPTPPETPLARFCQRKLAVLAPITTYPIAGPALPPKPPTFVSALPPPFPPRPPATFWTVFHSRSTSGLAERTNPAPVPPSPPRPPVELGFSTPFPPRPPRTVSTVFPNTVAVGGAADTRMPTAEPPEPPFAPGLAPFRPAEPRVPRTWLFQRVAAAPVWTHIPTANGPVVFVITLFAMVGEPKNSALIPVNVLLIEFHS